MSGWPWKPKPTPPVPPVPTTRTVAVIVCTEDGTRIEGAAVALQVSQTQWMMGDTDGSGYLEWAVTSSLANTQLRVAAEGYVDRDVSIVLTVGIDQQVWLGPGAQQPTALTLPAMVPDWAPPQPVQRGPLPPFDKGTTDPETGAPLPVATVIPYPVPGRDIRFWRGDAWSLTVPGLTPIPGGPSNPDMLCTYLFDRYPEADRGKALDAYCRAGYTHFTHSWPDARSHGMSLAQFVEMLKFVKRWELWNDVHFFSKDCDPQNPDPASVFPVIDALLDAGVWDIGTFVWEAPLVCTPEHYQTLTNALAGRAPKIPWFHHFTPHYCSYQRADPDTPHDFWERQPDNARGLKYQCVASPGSADSPDTWTAGMMQARINDGLVRLIAGGTWGLSRTFDFVAWETVAQCTFNGKMDEAHGNLRGYESLCSPGPMPVMGYGGGARMPDGNAL
jgi:hypothetical protein